MKKVLACLALGLLALGGGAVADIGTIDDVPAATLLLPYFEVDLDDPNGQTTLFSVNNASAAPAVAHITLWTDLSVPTLDFDVYLTGYDVQTINLRDIFNGFLPITADDGVDVTDTISPQGPLSQDLNFPGASGPCAGVYNSPQLDATLRAHLANLHTGGPSTIYSGGCGGLAYGDNIARGYVTVDNSNQCSLEFPSAPGYFAAGGTGIASNDNMLWGDYFFVNPGNNFASGENLVHIEACTLENEALETECPYVAGDYTFYARYIDSSGADGREPLGMTFAPRYTTGAGFDGTDLVVWRDSRSDATGAFACGTTPAWYPLNQADVVAFNEQEDAEERCFVGSDVSPPTGGEQTCYPAETGRYNVENSIVPGSQSVAPTFDFGWLYLNLSHTSTTPAQAWVHQIHSAEGRYSVGYDAIVLEYVPREYDSADGGLILSNGL